MLASYSLLRYLFLFFFFNDTAPTEIYTLSLHDALPISGLRLWVEGRNQRAALFRTRHRRGSGTHLLFSRRPGTRSEEHTSELQSHSDLVCRLLLEKKKKKRKKTPITYKKIQATSTHKT